MRELEQTWTGHGKHNCFEAMRQANNWIHSNRPDKFYDIDYARRSMHYSIGNNNMVYCWWNDGEDGELCDFIETFCKQIENMKKDDYYHINVSFIRGSWF